MENRRIRFGELRGVLSQVDRVSLCRKETMEYTNYLSVKDVPREYDDFWVYGVGIIESEFYSCEEKEDLVMEMCMEIVIGE